MLYDVKFNERKTMFPNFEKFSLMEKKDTTTSDRTDNAAEEQMKEYVVNGGKLFTITLIDTIRDGGTKIIKTTKDDYHIHKDSKKFHSGYAPTDENLITDFLLIEYLIERIETYIKRCEEDVERNKNLLIEIQNKK